MCEVTFMNIWPEIKLLLRWWLGILLYVVLLGVVLHDWGGAIFQGLLWGLVMSFVSPWILEWTAERQLRKGFNNDEQPRQGQ